MDNSNKNKIRVWMRQVLDKNGWTAREWATKANTSPTNITRFLNNQHDYLPSLTTIAKLSDVAGTQPNLEIADDKSELRWINIMDNDTFVDRVAISKQTGVVNGYLVLTESYNLGGIMPGDYILVEEKKPEINDLIAIKSEDKILIYKYAEGKILIPKSTNPTFEPHKITKDEKILGVIFESRKSRWD